MPPVLMVRVNQLRKSQIGDAEGMIILSTHAQVK